MYKAYLTIGLFPLLLGISIATCKAQQTTTRRALSTPVDTSQYVGKTPDEIKKMLGEPPVLVRVSAAQPAYSREVWVYFPYPEDPTGLYLYFLGNRVVRVYMDEFTGVDSPLILNWFSNY